MDQNNLTFVVNRLCSCRKSFFVLAVLVVTVPGIALCMNHGYALMIDKSPPAGGVVVPDIGIRQTSPNERIRISASPVNGYRFVYWLGDVEDPTQNHTTIFIDSPKLVVAVFERVVYQGTSGGGGSSRVVPTRTVTSPPFISPYNPPHKKPPPVPEPATIFLFGAGLVMLKSRRLARK